MVYNHFQFPAPGLAGQGELYHIHFHLPAGGIDPMHRHIVFGQNIPSHLERRYCLHHLPKFWNIGSRPPTRRTDQYHLYWKFLSCNSLDEWHPMLRVFYQPYFFGPVYHPGHRHTCQTHRYCKFHSCNLSRRRHLMMYNYFQIPTVGPVDHSGPLNMVKNWLRHWMCHQDM